jgi:two-component system phosphate regulon sensor histidine kinase PhoR
MVMLFAVAVIGLIFGQRIKGDLTEEIRNSLRDQARIMAFLSKIEIERRISSLAGISMSRVTLIGVTGWVIADSEKNVAELDNHLNRSEIQEARIKDHGEAIRYSHTLGVDMLYIAFPIKDGSQLTGYLRLARPLFEVKKSVDQLYSNVYKSLLIVTGLFLLIAVVFFRKIITPIQKVESFTQKVCSGQTPGTLMIESNDEIGRLAGNINCMVDVHQEKIRFALEEKGKLEAAFASMAEGVLILNGQDRIEMMNESLKSILGSKFTPDILNKTPLEAFRSVELEDSLERFRKTKVPVSQEITFGDENPVTLDIAISAVKGLPEGEEKTMMVFHDITRLKKLEKIREDFVANVTHEMKTPLTAIIGFVETLQEDAFDDTDTAKKFLQIISDNARRLDHLADDLLFLSSIELGEMKLRLEQVSLDSVIQSVLPVFTAKTAEKSLTIDTDIPETLPHILADRDRVYQVLLNILDNAVKFTSVGGKVFITASDDGKSHVVVKITDTGIGIPKSEIPRLGERFYRVDKTRSRDLGGAGLGLSIVKHLMKAHQGYLEIESQLGEGTTISLYFPIYQASSA